MRLAKSRGQRGNQDSNGEENLVCVSGFENGGEECGQLLEAESDP